MTFLPAIWLNESGPASKSQLGLLMYMLTPTTLFAWTPSSIRHSPLFVDVTLDAEPVLPLEHRWTANLELGVLERCPDDFLINDFRDWRLCVSRLRYPRAQCCMDYYPGAALMVRGSLAQPRLTKRFAFTVNHQNSERMRNP